MVNKPNEKRPCPFPLLGHALAVVLLSFTVQSYIAQLENFKQSGYTFFEIQPRSYLAILIPT